MFQQKGGFLLYEHVFRHVGKLEKEMLCMVDNIQYLINREHKFDNEKRQAYGSKWEDEVELASELLNVEYNKELNIYRSKINNAISEN